MPEHENEHQLRAPEGAFDELHDVPPAKEPGYETRDFLRRRLAMWFAVIISGLVVLSAIITIYLYGWFSNVAGPPGELLPRAGTGEFLPPAPRLQEAPHEDLHTYSEREESSMNDYGWVDREAGIVHVPIDIAMEQALAEGFPVGAEEPGGAETPGELEQ